MDKINQITKAVLGESIVSSTRSPKMPSTEVKLSSLVIVGLFKKFQARYLHKWTSAIDEIEEVAVNEWAVELGGLSPDQIKQGLDSLPDGWPPTAGDFRMLCEGGYEEKRLDASHKHVENRHGHILESDETKEKRKVAAKSAVSEMRKNIRG